MSDRFIEVEVDVTQVVTRLDEMRRRSMNLRPFMGAVGMLMIKSTHENFENEGRPVKWKVLSPLTQKIYEGAAMDAAIGKGLRSNRKTSKGRASVVSREFERRKTDLAGRKILQGDGDLKKSVVMGKVTNDSVEVGSSLIYARIHQLGGVIKPKKAKVLLIPLGGGKVLKLGSVTMPARPYLQLQPNDYQTMIRIAEDYLLRGEIG